MLDKPDNDALSNSGVQAMMAPLRDAVRAQLRQQRHEPATSDDILASKLADVVLDNVRLTWLAGADGFETAAVTGFGVVYEIDAQGVLTVRSSHDALEILGHYHDTLEAHDAAAIDLIQRTVKLLFPVRLR